MRRTSLTTDRAKQLAAVVRERREELGLSLREVSRRTCFNIATIISIEAGSNLSPLPDTLMSIAQVLRISVCDLYTVAGWLPQDELPTISRYMHIKYDELPDETIDAIAQLVRASRHSLNHRGDH